MRRKKGPEIFKVNSLLLLPNKTTKHSSAQREPDEKLR